MQSRSGRTPLCWFDKRGVLSSETLKEQREGGQCVDGSFSVVKLGVSELTCHSWRTFYRCLWVFRLFARLAKKNFMYFRWVGLGRSG